jgi:hypothetical protein
MCGRYASFLPAEAIPRIFGTVKPLPDLAPLCNVVQPTQGAAVVRPHTVTGDRHLDLLKWFAAALGEGTDQGVATERALIRA